MKESQTKYPKLIAFHILSFNIELSTSVYVINREKQILLEKEEASWRKKVAGWSSKFV